MAAERLQKVLARAGIGSRREVEDWIRQGRIRINGEVAGLGVRVTNDDKVEIDGRRLSGGAIFRPQQKRVIAYHKPVGEITTRRDPEGRPTVFANLPSLDHGRWIAVGRLDLNTSGLLLFTNDGELAEALMHPRRSLPREYAVRVLGSLDPVSLSALLGGVELEDGPVHVRDIREGGGTGANRWYHMTLVEGRNRIVRRLFDTLGIKVSRLIRVGYGPVALDRKLRAGKCRELSGEEIDALMKAAGLKAPDTGAAGRRSSSRRTSRKRKP